MANGCGARLTSGAQQTTDGGSVFVTPGLDVEDAPPEGWPLRRVISIEEDHLPHLLQGDAHPLLHQLSEEEKRRGEEEEAQLDLNMSPIYSSNVSLASAHSPASAHVKKPLSKHKGRKGMVPSSARGQPVGKETMQKVKEWETLLNKSIYPQNPNK